MSDDELLALKEAVVLLLVSEKERLECNQMAMVEVEDLLDRLGGVV